MMVIIHKDLARGLGEAIRRRRRERKWTLLRLSRAAGVSQSFLCQIEGNTSEPSLEFLCKICQALELKVSHLFSLAELYSQLPYMEQEVMDGASKVPCPKHRS